MAKTRLRATDREKLFGLAKQRVCPKREQQTLKQAAEKATPLVRAIVEKKFPPADMAICAKYDVAAIDDCIKLRLPSERITRFDFDKNTGPVVTRATYTGQIYDADNKTSRAVERWEKARSAFREARDALLRDYRAFIYGCRNYEDVVAAWPEAEELADQIKRGTMLPVPVSVVERIQADAASRKKAA